MRDCIPLVCIYNYICAGERASFLDIAEMCLLKFPCRLRTLGVTIGVRESRGEGQKMEALRTLTLVDSLN